MLCLSDGTITFTSEVQAGSVTDNNEYEDSKVKEAIEKMYRNSPLPPLFKFVLGDDKGYIYSIPPEGWELIVTKSGKKELKNGSDQADGDRPHESNKCVAISSANRAL